MSLQPRARTGLACPVDATHGALVPWTGSGRFGWYCPHDGHDGSRDVPQTRAFFTTAEAEAGSLAPEPLTGADTPAAELRRLTPPAAAVPQEPQPTRPSPGRAAVPGSSVPGPVNQRSALGPTPRADQMTRTQPHGTHRAGAG